MRGCVFLIVYKNFNRPNFPIKQELWYDYLLRKDEDLVLSIWKGKIVLSFIARFTNGTTQYNNQINNCSVSFFVAFVATFNIQTDQSHFSNLRSVCLWFFIYNHSLLSDKSIKLHTYWKAEGLPSLKSMLKTCSKTGVLHPGNSLT